VIPSSIKTTIISVGGGMRRRGATDRRMRGGGHRREHSDENHREREGPENVFPQSKEGKLEVDASPSSRPHTLRKNQGREW